jgi:hypothetical protein
MVALVAALLAFPGLASAWSNGGYSADESNPDFGTHDWIADMALRAIGSDASLLSEDYRSEFLLGTEAPDNPDYIGDYLNHHVYYYSSGSVQDDAAADRAAAMFAEAVSALDAGRYDEAAFDAGAMVHYISDMGVFGHTMGSETDWGSEDHHSDYEDQVEFLIDDLGEKDLGDIAGATAYDAAMSLARDTTFGEGDIRSNVWMDSNYDWDDPVFVASATASLYASVEASASALITLLEELPEPPAEEPADDPVPDEPAIDPVTDEPTKPGTDEGLWATRLAIAAAAVATGIVALLVGRRMVR